MILTDWQDDKLTNCPKCLKNYRLTWHRKCPEWERQLRLNLGYNVTGPILPVIMIDLHSGLYRCNLCREIWPFEDHVYHCECGARFTGGKVWQAIALEIGQTYSSKWVRRTCVNKGRFETKFLGWGDKYTLMPRDIEGYYFRIFGEKK